MKNLNKLEETVLKFLEDEEANAQLKVDALFLTKCILIK